MHETSSPDFKGYIEDVDTSAGVTKIRGWIIGLQDHVAHCVFTAGATTFRTEIIRPDVAEWFKSDDPRYIHCGFDIVVPDPGRWIDISARTDTAEFPLFRVEVPVPVPLPDTSLRPPHPPAVVVVDEFYNDPDGVRAFALRQRYGEDLRNYKGQRTSRRFLFPGIRERFEELLGARITRWEDMGANGVFQFCTSQEPLVYHADTQMYAATIYLTPNAPPQCGTSFFRSRINPEVRRWPSPGYEYHSVFPTGHYDRTQFELVDIVGNFYNRLVLWDAKLLHSASEYFGDQLENSRLFHLFFFDVDFAG